MSCLQIFCAVTGGMSMISVGIFIGTSGCILPQLEEPNDDLQITEDQGSWFGNISSNDDGLSLIELNLLTDLNLSPIKSWTGICCWHTGIPVWWDRM